MDSFKLAKKGDKSSKSSLFNWSMSDGDLHEQVDSYGSLKITQSYRGIAFLAIMFSMALTIALVAFGVLTFDSLYSLVIYLPLAAFIYLGHRWAIIAMMILWTIEKGYSISVGSSFIVALIWWSIYMGIFYKALKVENARKK